MAWAASAFAVPIFSLFVLLRLTNSRTVTRVSHLLEDVRALRVNESTRADVEEIVRRHGGGAVDGIYRGVCPKGGPAYSVRIQSDEGWIGRKASFLGLFGPEEWSVQARFKVEDGRLCFAEFQVRDSLARGVQGSLAIDASVASNRSYPHWEGSAYGVGLRAVHNVHNLSAMITDGATKEQRERAFDFDLSCLSRIGGCRGACELMPSVWVDYQKEAHANGWPLPPEEANDPHCRKLEDAR
jgi:hypothetical protein